MQSECPLICGDLASSKPQPVYLTFTTNLPEWLTVSRGPLKSGSYNSRSSVAINRLSDILRPQVHEEDTAPTFPLRYFIPHSFPQHVLVTVPATYLRKWTRLSMMRSRTAGARLRIGMAFDSAGMSSLLRAWYGNSSHITWLTSTNAWLPRKQTGLWSQ